MVDNLIVGWNVVVMLDLKKIIYEMKKKKKRNVKIYQIEYTFDFYSDQHIHIRLVCLDILGRRTWHHHSRIHLYLNEM